MKKRTIIYTLLAIFMIFTLFKIIIIYVLNISSLDTHYTYHSNSTEESKSKGLFISKFSLDKLSSKYSLVDSLIPKEFFIEREKIIYPQYYFYWGKSALTSRLTMNGSIFLDISKSGSYDISCPLSTIPTEKENIDKYREDIYFYFNTIPAAISFFLYSVDDKTHVDTLVYKKN